ncbi:transporter substrate-binding domain-containing protein [Lutibaculum baratangense]|nr:transporter substrate-binding domain-containing protein [Lutibaculum baratangense]
MKRRDAAPVVPSEASDMRRPPPHRRLPAIAFACVLAMPLSACDEFPRDPDGTLQSARGGTIEVGLIEASPWVAIEDGVPQGLEVELAAAFAASLDAEVEWIRGTPEEVLEALEARRIHLVVGGLTQDSAWGDRVALTRPYLETALVAVAPGSGGPERVEGNTVAVSPGTVEAAAVRAAGGVPVAPDMAGSTASLEVKPS